MISRILVRNLGLNLRRVTYSTSFLKVPQYTFSRNKIQKAPSTLNLVIESEIKAEEQSLIDLSERQNFFSDKGWTLNRDGLLVELSKDVGSYSVRVLSNIKTPTNFGNEDEKKEPQEVEEEDPQGQMNEVTICVTKKGSEKTMSVHAIVTQSYEISNVNFSSSYAEAKKSRLDIFSGTSYTGPEMESLSDELFEGIYTFLEQECDITDELLQNYGDYCVDSEQSFYINWLKDLKNMM